MLGSALLSPPLASPDPEETMLVPLYASEPSARVEAALAELDAAGVAARTRPARYPCPALWGEEAGVSDLVVEHRDLQAARVALETFPHPPLCERTGPLGSVFLRTLRYEEDWSDSLARTSSGEFVLLRSLRVQDEDLLNTWRRRRGTVWQLAELKREQLSGWCASTALPALRACTLSEDGPWLDLAFAFDRPDAQPLPATPALTPPAALRALRVLREAQAARPAELGSPLRLEDLRITASGDLLWLGLGLEGLLASLGGEPRLGAPSESDPERGYAALLAQLLGSPPPPSLSALAEPLAARDLAGTREALKELGWCFECGERLRAGACSACH